MNEFSIRLKQAMDKAHMKQVDLCNATGILKSLISGYVNGNFYPKRDNLTVIAKALNVTPKWLLFGDEAEYQHDDIKNEDQIIKGERFMNNEKIKEIAVLLSGLKRYEWGRVKMVIEKQFDSASAQLQLPDAESIAKKLELEFFGTIQ